MYIEFSKDGAKAIKPEIKHDENGEAIALGTCWVKGDNLLCYNWEDEEALVIYSKIPASEENIPVDQYYCFNINKFEYGWVTEDQVTFELSSLFGEPYRVKKV